ncbi:MAG TPA: STN domain-containing protein [Phycisphaerae bacterium]|nr:STN domain-containing protein [Phycisphaerae bacterium]
MIQFILTAVLLALAPADEDRAIVQQALDQPITLEITDTPLEDACRRIADDTGISVRMGADALALLPYGEGTRVNVRWRRTPLSEGLRVLCDQIGMDYTITRSGIAIVPAPPLMRLGRTASWEELNTVSELMRTNWTGDDDDFQEVRKQIHFEGVPGDPEDLRKELRHNVENGGRGSAAEVLTQACARMGCVWIPWADGIKVMSRAQFVRYELQRVVSLKFHNAALADVLLDLAHQSGVPMRLEPATAATLPERVKDNITLVAEGVTVEEALEQLVIATGLAYEVQDDGVLLSRPAGVDSAASGAAASRQRDPIVGKIVIPSPDGKHTYEWFIRESDLTPDERARLEKIKRDGIEAMQRDLKR